MTDKPVLQLAIRASRLNSCGAMDSLPGGIRVPLAERRVGQEETSRDAGRDEARWQILRPTHMASSTLEGLTRLAFCFSLILFIVIVISVTDVRTEMTGKQDFDRNCASCHGKDARGHGESLGVLPGVEPPDLTTLSKANGGTFPVERVYEWIDGRAKITEHSRINMPFWGTIMQQEGKEFTPESEAKVKARISKLVNYIKSIQEK